MPGFAQAVTGKLTDKVDVGLVDGAMGILVGALVTVAVVRLGVGLGLLIGVRSQLLLILEKSGI